MTIRFASLFLFFIVAVAFNAGAAEPLVPAAEAPTPTSLDDIARQLPAFDTVPFNESGFFTLFLPFRYSSTSSGFDRTEADALTFLMSQDLDWAPQNFGARHAFFVFEREAEYLKPFRERYDDEQTSKLVKHWEATHAIGGVLQRTATGLSATLEIYDPQGKQVFQKHFPAEPFERLLGDMDLAAMRFFGFDPPLRLAEYFYQPRCVHPESIAAVGRLAFLPRTQMLEQLADILKVDPTFGDAYAWWAGQYGWEVNDTTQTNIQRALSVEERLVPQPLIEFDVASDVPPEIMSAFRSRVAAAEQIAGDDSNVVMTAKLTYQTFDGIDDEDLRTRALAAAKKYPNADSLLQSIASNLAQTGRTDGELGAALCLAEIHSLYQPGVGDQRSSFIELGHILRNLWTPGSSCLGVRSRAGKVSLHLDRIMWRSGRGWEVS